MKTISNLTNKYENVSIFYFGHKFNLSGWKAFNLDRWLHYFFVIDNELHLLEYEKNFKHYTDYFKNLDIEKSQKKDQILNYNNFESVEFDHAILIKNLWRNAGHSFSNIINHIYRFLNSNIENKEKYTVIIPKELSDNNFLKSVIYFFFKEEQCFILNEKILVKCKTLYNMTDCSYNNCIHNDYLLNKLNPFNSHKQIHKNIMLIKIKDSNLNTSTLQGFNQEYIEYFQSRDFTYINAIDYELVELYNIINNADNIIFSWGCTSYINSPYVNKKANVLILCHNSYNSEYNKKFKPYVKSTYFKNTSLPDILEWEYFPRDLNWEKETNENTFEAYINHRAVLPRTCNRLILIDKLTSDLTKETKDLLDTKINKMIGTRKDANARLELDREMMLNEDFLGQDRRQNDLKKQEITNVSEKNISKKNVSEKNISKKNVSEKNISKKNVSEKNVSEKKISKVTSNANSSKHSTIVVQRFFRNCFKNKIN